MNPFEATVAHRIILRIEFTPPMLEAPVFCSDAAWLRVLDKALARSGCVPKHDGQQLVMLRLAKPATDSGAFAGPAETIDADFVEAVVSALAAQGWNATANTVLIREEAVERDGLLLDVAIYDTD